MVTWSADGGVSGYEASTGVTTDSKFLLASPGMVDAEGITRIQYPMPAGLIDNLRAIANLTISSGDVALNGGKKFTATMFIIPSWYFADGVTPTPSDILALGPHLRAFRSTSFRTTAGALNLASIDGPISSSLQPNTKYWVLVMPTVVSSMSSPANYVNDKPVFMSPDQTDTIGRGISIWTNRSPAKPTITAPNTGTTVSAGSTIPALTFTTNDPDEIAGPLTPNYLDLGGVQVQYAPRPTVDDPTPAWVDLPISNSAATVLGKGWYIDGAASYNPANDDGAHNFYTNRTMALLCGSNALAASEGALPSGSWQIRLRVFDYGHPYPSVLPPSADVSGNYTPDTFPFINTSPWSDTINVTVSAQVPPPILLSPINNNALAEGQPITLDWLFRDTYTPPAASQLNGAVSGVVSSITVDPLTEAWPSGTHILMANGMTINVNAPAAIGDTAISVTSVSISPSCADNSPVIPQPYIQNSCTVQIRKAGETSWTTLFTGARAASNYPIPAVVPPSTLLHDDGTSTTGWTKLTATTGPTVVSSEVEVTGPTGLSTESNPLMGLTRALVAGAGLKTITVSGHRTNIETSGGTGEQALAVYCKNGVSFVSSTTVADTGSYPGGFDGSTKTASAWSHKFTVTGAIDSIHVELASANSGAGVKLEVDDVLVVAAASGYDMLATTEFEWRVQVTDSNGVTSNYSEIGRFWVVPAPASGEVRPLPSETIDAATLGCGKHTAYVYRRGGKRRVGEIRNVTHLDWGRVRDDISTSKIEISGWDIDCGNLLSLLQTWAYEIVIFRDNGYSVDRVWEGPITLLTYETDKVTIDAKDVMGYVYRRILKQDMNDSVASDTVVSRAARVIQNVLAPDDPNVLAYLTILSRDDDSVERRSTAAYSRTGFEEVDDMAANNGLDYTAVGRAILLWGTRHRIGTLPEFRDDDLGSPPIVSEYGMSFANRYALTDGAGVYGEATRLDVSGNDPIYGLVEMLSTTTQTDSSDETGTYTAAGLAATIATFEGYAERAISDRFPPPVVVRIPDNTSLNPGTVLSIQQLIPGVAIPLRSTGTLRSVVATQKLDSVKVVEESGKETISITLSPFSSDDASLIEGE